MKQIKKQAKAKTLDLGSRNVCQQNFSWIITLPHTFVENFLKETKKVKLELASNGQLILTPITPEIEKVEKNE